MKFLMLVCWDAEKMDPQTAPEPTKTPDEESFPWLPSGWAEASRPGSRPRRGGVP
jgi:hypothetical protein